MVSELFPKTVKATDINLAEFSIDGFSLFLSKIEDKSRGVGIYVKDSLSCIECSVLDNRTFKESCWCEIVLKNNEKSLLGAICRSPSSGTATSLRLNQLISTAIGLSFSNAVLFGDFKYPNIDWTE